MKSTMKRATCLLLLLALMGMAAACKSQEPNETTPAETPTHEVTTQTPTVMETVTLQVVDQNGAPIPEAVVTVVPADEGTESATLNADAEGRCSVTLPVGSYTVRFDVLPEYTLGVDTEITVTSGMEPILLTVTDNTPNGTEERPFVISESSVTVAMPAGATYFYTLFGGNNRTLSVENPHAEIQYKDTVYTPDENGLIEVRMSTDNPRDPSFFALSNKGEESCEMTIAILSDPGAMDNPIEITELGVSVTATVPKDGMIYYKWIATASGTLTVSSTDVINNISLNNLTTSQVSNFTEGKETETLKVSEGDVITVVVSVLGGDANADSQNVTFLLAMGE